MNLAPDPQSLNPVPDPHISGFEKMTTKYGAAGIQGKELQNKVSAHKIKHYGAYYIHQTQHIPYLMNKKDLKAGSGTGTGNTSDHKTIVVIILR
jgi:hypothetical protein